MVHLTEGAVNAVKNAMSAAKEPVTGLRIIVEAGGCSGNKYTMGLVNQPKEGDVVVEDGGVKVFVDPGSVAKLQGTTIDFVVGLEGAGFAFNNPQAQASCSCGKSFS